MACAVFYRNPADVPSLARPLSGRESWNRLCLAISPISYPSTLVANLNISKLYTYSSVTCFGPLGSLWKKQNKESLRVCRQFQPKLHFFTEFLAKEQYTGSLLSAVSGSPWSGCCCILFDAFDVA